MIANQTKPTSPRFIDITGRKVGTLSVLDYVGRIGSREMWLCKCDCGKEKRYSGVMLRGQHVKHCGCQRPEAPRKIVAQPGQVKCCKVCKIEKPLSEFYYNGKGKDGHKSKCIKCNREYFQNWTKANAQRIKEGREKVTRTARKRTKEELFDTKLKHLYGITTAQYEAMIVSQGNACAICGIQPDPTKEYKKRFWDVDHDHNTGKVRGLLCHRCNIGLGGFQDSQPALAKAIEYLKTHSS